MKPEPYATEHRRSLAAQMAPPKDLLSWFIREYRAELPDSIHVSGVWRDRKRRGDPLAYQPVGGSLTGAPRDAVPFQAYIEDSAFACEVAEYEGHKDRNTHYVYPLRAALASLAGRGKPTDDYPFMARTLYRTALMDGDWQAACASMGIVEPVARTYVEAALHRLWRRYSVEPPARSLRGEGHAA